MDGDSQSAWSIVQSLRDAGLLVTVVDGKGGGNSATAVLAINTAPRPCERRSLGINTRFNPTQHCSTQASDSRYASVYQLSHCGYKPTSPPLHVSEFPLQRTTPHLTEGNFEVPGWSSGESQYPPVRSTHSCRGSLRWTDRVGSVYRYSEDTSAFAHSLRKYPELSPSRSLSAELVQRLLSYTHNKSFTKSFSHTQNASRPASPQTKPNEGKKSSKNARIYTKNKLERLDKASNTAYEMECQGILPTDRSIPGFTKRPNTTYDYLRRTKPRGWNTRGTEVRYLTDVTKCIKDAIRHICEEAATPVMCPSVQSRYSHHRRMHHLHTNGQEPSSCNNQSDAVAAPDENSARRIMPCGSPNNACPKIRTRYNHHKKQQHGGQKSRSDLKTSEVQACPTPVMREASVTTRSESPTTQQHVRGAPSKTCCFCKRPLPCHCRSETDRKIEKEILEWMKEIPVYSDDTTDNRHLRCILSKKLVENLQKIIKNGEFGKIREEIDKCLNVLPMWCPENDNDKTTFMNQMAENLMNRLKQFTEKDYFREKIVLWFNELPFLDKIEQEDRDKILNNLVNRLKAVDRLPDDNDYKEALKNEVVKILNEIPGIDKDATMEMAQKLVDSLIPTEKTFKNEILKEIREKICQWIDDTPEFAENGFYIKDNNQHIDDLTNTLTEHQKGTDNEKAKELMSKDIADWLQNRFKNKNVFFDLNTKNKIVQKLIDKIYPSETKSPAGQYVQSIFDWLKDAPELAQFINEETLVEELARKLEDLYEKGYDDDALLEVIVDWINQLCEKHGITIDPKVVRQLARKFLENRDLKKRISRKPLKLAQDFQKTISDGIARILDHDATTLNSKVKKNLQNKITNILSETIENVLQGETAEAKKDLVKLFQHEGNITQEEAKNLADTVISSTKSMPLTEGQRKSSTKPTLHTKKDVKEEVITEVDELVKPDIKLRKHLQDTNADRFPDEVMRGTQPHTATDDIYDSLDTSAPDSQFYDVSPKTVIRRREMSLEPTSPYLDSSSKSHTPTRKDSFKENPEGTVLDFIDNVLINYTPETIESIRKGGKTLIDNVSQLIQRNDDGQSVLKEVQRFLNNVPISSDITRKELADDLTSRLLESGFATSTPRKDFSFQPRRLTFESSLPAVHVQDESQATTPPTIEEDRYRYNLTKVVKLWLDKMPLSLNDNESKRFKEVVINDLVGDMIDRQKYLQLNPDTKSSDIEELEYLKYQVFRWLNKVIHAPDFDIVMPQAKALMGAVRRIAVPQLVKPSGGRRDGKKSVGQVPEYQDALQDEISIWIDDIPRHLHQSTDKKYHDNIVKELARNLQFVDNENILVEIKKWLKKFFKFTSQDDVHKAAENLKKKLARKGFSKDASWMLKQDSGEFIEENLQGGILDWLKETPLYKSANRQDRNTQEKIIVGMANGIKNVFETALTTSKYVDTNDLFMQEIIKYLKRFPMDEKQKSNTNFLKQTAANLLRHLKRLQMFQNVSDRHTAITEDSLSVTVDDWIDSLPIVDKQSVSHSKHFNDITKHFKQNLNNLKNIGDEKRLRDEIKKQLKLLPLDPVRLSDEQFLNKKVEQLLKEIQKHPSEQRSDYPYEDISPLGMIPEATNEDYLSKYILENELDNFISLSQPNEDTERNINLEKKVAKTKPAKGKVQGDMAGLIYKQQLRDTISETLPSIDDLSVDEKNSFEILKNNLADAFINLRFYGDNVEEKGKFKNKIKNEISKFCNDYLKRHPSTPIDAETLNRELNAKLNNISFPPDDTIRDEVEETRLKDLLTDYVNKFPLNQETSAEKLQANKVMSLMSKGLHELEKEKDILDDYDDKLKSEIVKWMKKLPLKHGAEENINEFANRLVGELKKTEALRTFDSTNMDTPYFDGIIYSDMSSLAPHERSRPSRVADSPAPRLPPSTLSPEDRDHLQRIRERSMPGRRLRTSPARKDAAISPAPIDAGSQTELRPWEDNANIQRRPSIPPENELEQAPHICQSPTCGLRSPRPYLQSERSHCHLSPKTSVRDFNTPRQGQRERLLPCDIIQPESLPTELKSSSCECQPKFLPYIFSPGQKYTTPQTSVHPPRHAPDHCSPFQCNLPNEVPATPKRPKRRDQSPPRRQERPRRTIRPRTAGLASWRGCQDSSKEPDNHKQTCGATNLPGGVLCGSVSRREVLISDDEFEVQDIGEKPKCGCKEGDLSKNYGRNGGLSCKGECMKRCPKCCGMHCPHPSNLYFRN